MAVCKQKLLNTRHDKRTCFLSRSFPATAFLTLLCHIRSGLHFGEISDIFKEQGDCQSRTQLQLWTALSLHFVIPRERMAKFTISFELAYIRIIPFVWTRWRHSDSPPSAKYEFISFITSEYI